MGKGIITLASYFITLVLITYSITYYTRSVNAVEFSNFNTLAEKTAVNTENTEIFLDAVDIRAQLLRPTLAGIRVEFADGSFIDWRNDKYTIRSSAGLSTTNPTTEQVHASIHNITGTFVKEDWITPSGTTQSWIGIKYREV